MIGHALGVCRLKGLGARLLHALWLEMRVSSLTAYVLGRRRQARLHAAWCLQAAGALMRSLMPLCLGG